MNVRIKILLDYKGRFETRYTANPYRGGMDKELLKKYFLDRGFEADFLFFQDINFRDKSLQNKIFLYCSSEDIGGYYKSYVEDIVLGLKSAGAVLIPDFLYLRAHHNKVFMEILRDLLLSDLSPNIKSKYYGTRESLIEDKAFYSKRSYVIKPSGGSMSKGVEAAESFEELLNLSGNVSRTEYFWEGLKDSLRRLIYKGYIPDSRFRKKFVIQNMIKDLSGDWKVLIFGSKYYILKRENRKNDFRASGGGRLSFTQEIPPGLLDYAEKIKTALSVPNISLDIGFKEKDFYLFEFQCLYFGSYTLEHSDFYYIKDGMKWKLVIGKSLLEEEYCRSISDFITRRLKQIG